MPQRYASGTTESSQSTDNVELRLDTYTTLGGQFSGVFPTQSQFGQSLAVNIENVTIQDGALYAYPEKGYYKLFSWSSVAGLDPEEAVERGMEPDVDDAPEIETKTYAGNELTYELVAARIPEITSEAGEVLVESQSKARDIDMSTSPPEFTEWEYLDGEAVTFDDVIMWYDGSDEYGPSASSKRLLELLTEYGSDPVADEDDIHNWLPEIGVGNILREDLQGRTIRMYEVTQESDNGFEYNVPVIEDAATGEQVQAYNISGGDSDELEAARESDTGTWPEPIADFMQSVDRLDMPAERAGSMLDELVSDQGNPLTEDMLADNGGRDTIIAEATG